LKVTKYVIISNYCFKLKLLISTRYSDFLNTSSDFQLPVIQIFKKKIPNFLPFKFFQIFTVYSTSYSDFLEISIIQKKYRKFKIKMFPKNQRETLFQIPNCFFYFYQLFRFFEIL